MARIYSSDVCGVMTNNQNAILKEIESFNANKGDKRRCGLRYLWRGVIAQALIDALNHSEKLSNKIERARAIAWFSTQNKDFLIVCAYADLDPSYVLEKVKIAMKER